MEGQLGRPGVYVIHKITASEQGLEESLSLHNRSSRPVSFAQFQFGFRLPFTITPASSRLVAVPYRRQADGALHDYSAADLQAGRAGNSDISSDPTVARPPFAEEGALRSEGWIWGDDTAGLIWIKYNPQHIEYALCMVEDGQALRFGGAGLALYGEPRMAAELPPGKTFEFGRTYLQTFDGDWASGYAVFKEFLNRNGHGLRPDYRPPLNWNELFDVGWYHSDPIQLRERYTRQALMNEAAKAKEIGCELLYLDPGWEVCEGATLWDSSRLGPVAGFIREVRQRYGLRVGYRTIGRVYRDEFPNSWYMRRKGENGACERPTFG